MNKTFLKIIIIISCVIALIVVALGTTFYFLAIYDAPAPDDSAYKTVYTLVPPETNAIATLSKLKDKVKTDLKDYPGLDKGPLSEKWNALLANIEKKNADFEKRTGFSLRNVKVAGASETAFTPSRQAWDRFMQGEINDPELQAGLQALLIAHNSEALEILSEAMTKPNAQFEPLFAGNGTLRTFPSGEFMNINKIARMTWQNTRDGKAVFAWGEAFNNIQFANRLGAAENAALLDFLVALACETADADFMLRNIGGLEGRETAIKAASFLNDGTLTVADFKNVLKMEYQFVSEATRPFEEILNAAHPAREQDMLKMTRGMYSFNFSGIRSFFIKKLLFRYILKPNATRQQALQRMAVMCEAIDRGDHSLGIPPAKGFFTKAKPSFAEKCAYFIKPNAVGRMILDLGSSNLDAIYQGILDNIARFRVEACAFALRAYWLDHGKLPDTLDELAPKYIKAVPLDIYGGKPVQYDRERGVVYSAGAKLVYGTGEFARDPDAAKRGDSRYFVLLDWEK